MRGAEGVHVGGRGVHEGGRGVHEGGRGGGRVGRGVVPHPSPGGGRLNRPVSRVIVQTDQLLFSHICDTTRYLQHCCTTPTATLQCVATLQFGETPLQRDCNVASENNICVIISSLFHQPSALTYTLSTLHDVRVEHSACVRVSLRLTISLW